jgi:hypothetical protein
VFETQQYHFVGHASSISESGSTEAGDKSILGALDPELGESDGELVNEEEYAASMKELEAELALEELVDQPPAIKQVITTNADNGGGKNLPKGGTKPAAEAAKAVPPLAPAPPQQQPLEIQAGGSGATSGRDPTLPPPSTSNAGDPFVTPADKIMYG